MKERTDVLSEEFQNIATLSSFLVQMSLNCSGSDLKKRKLQIISSWQVKISLYIEVGIW